MKPTYIYKIRDKQTGLFSTGGTTPYFEKGGKIWKAKGHVTSHLNLVNKRYYKNAEIVEIEIVETPANIYSIEEWHQPALERQKARDEAYEKFKAEQEKAKRRADYERLQKEFGGLPTNG